MLEAAGHSDDDGMALEQFRVENNYGDEVRWDRVIRDLEKVLDGRLALEARLAERRACLPPAPSVAGAGHPSGGHRRQRAVRTPTRWSRCGPPTPWGCCGASPGPSHELDLDIISAKVQTLSSDAVDSFYVRDSVGHKVTDAEYLDEIHRALMFALEGPDAT